MSYLDMCRTQKVKRHIGASISKASQTYIKTRQTVQSGLPKDWKTGKEIWKKVNKAGFPCYQTVLRHLEDLKEAGKAAKSEDNGIRYWKAV